MMTNDLLSPSVVLLRFANDNVEFGEELKVVKILIKYDALQKNDDHDYYDQDPHDNDDHIEEAPL